MVREKVLEFFLRKFFFEKFVTEKSIGIGLVQIFGSRHALLGINKTFVDLRNLTSLKLRVYFMDKINSVRIYPNDMEMTGDPIKMKLNQEQSEALSFRTEISRYEHVEGDPLLDCALYAEDNSYSKCARKELLDVFKKELGCVPPLLEQKPQHMCNKKFNFTKSKDRYMDRLFKPMYFHNRKFECKPPCTKHLYSSRFVHASPSDNMYLVIVFDKMVNVVHSSFSIDGQTLLARLGGSVSSGRTLLWVLLTILAAAQVYTCTHYPVPCGIDTFFSRCCHS